MSIHRRKTKLLKLVKNALFVSLIAVGACTHTNVAIVKPADDKLSCSDISAEIAEINGILRDIDDKTGMSGRNIAMGVFFWPGIVVNQMNAGDAREAASERLKVLAELKSNKGCN